MQTDDDLTQYKQSFNKRIISTALELDITKNTFLNNIRTVIGNGGSCMIIYNQGWQGTAIFGCGWNDYFAGYYCKYADDNGFYIFTILNNGTTLRKWQIAIR